MRKFPQTLTWQKMILTMLGNLSTNVARFTRRRKKAARNGRYDIWERQDHDGFSNIFQILNCNISKTNDQIDYFLGTKAKNRGELADYCGVTSQKEHNLASTLARRTWVDPRGLP